MGWQVGWDADWRRWVGYGVPAVCDHPACVEQIDRGLAYRCGDLDSGEGCGLFFCSAHKPGRCCERCMADEDPFDPAPDTAEWVEHMLTDPSWDEWRARTPGAARAMIARSVVCSIGQHPTCDGGSPNGPLAAGPCNCGCHFPHDAGDDRPQARFVRWPAPLGRVGRV